MIQPDHVDHLKDRAKPFQPPPVAIASQNIPAVNRIPPKLARLAEVIRRNARHDGRVPVRIEMIMLWVDPDIGAVMRDIDRQVAHQPDPAVAAMLAQLPPLRKKSELLELLNRDRLCQLFPPVRQCRRPSPSDARFPMAPAVPSCCCFSAMNSAKSSNQLALAWQKESNRCRSPDEARAKNRRAADSSSAIFQGMTRSKSA